MMLADAPCPAGRWEGEGRPLSSQSLKGLLAWAVAVQASDIRLETNKRVILQVHGRVRKLGIYRLTASDMGLATEILRGADGMAQIKSGQDWDVRYETGDRYVRHAFRVNGKGSYADGKDGAALVLRPLPTRTRPLSEQNVDPRIMADLFPREGIVLICGGTGEGKTTLLGGTQRHILEAPDSHCVMTEFGSPIENCFDDIDAETSEVTQVEVGRSLPTFAAAIRNLMRSACKKAVVNECRDPDTMGAAIQAGLTDHALYTSLHAASARAAIQRAVSLCPEAERRAMEVALAQALRLIVVQRLVFSTDGTRTPIREFCSFDRRFRDQLADLDPLRWPDMVAARIEEHGTGFDASIRTALAERRITEEIAGKELANVA